MRQLVLEIVVGHRTLLDVCLNIFGLVGQNVRTENDVQVLKLFTHSYNVTVRSLIFVLILSWTC